MQEERIILILTHNHIGGSKLFLNEYIASEFKGCEIYFLQAENVIDNPKNLPDKLILTNYHDPEQKLIFDASVKNFNEIIKNLRVTEIFINHLIHFNLDFITICLLSSCVPFTYFIHDYNCICCNTHLAYCYLSSCELSTTNEICKHYLEEIKIKNWREIWEIFLSSAKKIIAPSSYAADIVRHVYPNLPIEVRPHFVIAPLSRTFKAEFATREKLRIAFLGVLSEYKGAKYLFQLNEFIRRENLPIEFVVIGDYPNKLFIDTNEGIIFAGAYEVNEISNRLAEYETGIVAVLSSVAETYCYTASEAILSGYPVITLSIGAHALRVTRNDCGWVIPFDTEDRGLGDLKDFLRVIITDEGRKDILLKSANTKNFKNGDD